MMDSPHILPDDLSLYAMRLLDAPEAAEIEGHLRGCDVCRYAVAEAHTDLAVLALTVDLASPRASSRERFMDQVAAEDRRLEPRSEAVAAIHLDEPTSARPRRQAIVPLVAPVTTPPPMASAAQASPEPPSLGAPVTEIRAAAKPSGVLPWLGWAIAAGVSIFAVNQYRERAALTGMVARQSAELQVVTTHLAAFSAEAVRSRELLDTLTSPEAVRVTLNTTPAAKALPQGRLNYVADKGTLVLIANNLQPVAPGKVYQLWIIPADGTAPVPAGTFTPDARGSASVVMPAIPKQLAAKAFGVTLEAEGGASTPTLPILLAGAV